MGGFVGGIAGSMVGPDRRSARPITSSIRASWWGLIGGLVQDGLSALLTDALSCDRGDICRDGMRLR